MDMKISVHTKVSASIETIQNGFNEELFMALNPPFPKVEVSQFDGCMEGDKVILTLFFPFFEQIWESDIVAHGRTNEEWFFVDKGVKLPFFLRSWKHHHVVRNIGNKREIIDDIEYTTGTFLTDLLMFPVLKAQFLYRKPIYKKFFDTKKPSTERA